MKILKTIIHIKLAVIALLLLPFIALTLLTSKTAMLNGIRSFVVLTGSMSPVIPQGSLIYTRKAATFEKGDVIAFQKENIVVTHRIAEVVNNNSFKTKGDANNAIDSQVVLPSQILGKQIFYIPYIGNFFIFLKTLPGFIALVVMPGILFIAFELFKIKKEMEKEIEKKLKAKIVNATV